MYSVTEGKSVTATVSVMSDDVTLDRGVVVTVMTSDGTADSGIVYMPTCICTLERAIVKEETARRIEGISMYMYMYKLYKLYKVACKHRHIHTAATCICICNVW